MEACNRYLKAGANYARLIEGALLSGVTIGHSSLCSAAIGRSCGVASEVDLCDELAEKCLRLARALDLPFAGLDLKVTPENEVYCFEVNPSLAFSYYEGHTGQPISAGLAACLMEADLANVSAA